MAPRRQSSAEQSSTASELPIEWTSAVAVVIFFIAFAASGRVLPWFFTSQCTAQPGMCTPGTCSCPATHIKRELVTQDANVCYQCVDNFCPAVVEGGTNCSLNACECEDATWPRRDIGTNGASCWQCIHPVLDLTLRTGSGKQSACLSGAVGEHLVDISGSNAQQVNHCITFRYNGASLLDKRDNESCLTWQSSSDSWTLENCLAGSDASVSAVLMSNRTFRQHPASESNVHERFCLENDEAESHCLNPVDYMCTTDTTQCSMGSCRCENSSWVKQELHTLNGTKCYMCTPPVTFCAKSMAEACTPDPCHCADFGYQKVLHHSVNAQGIPTKKECFVCRPPEVRNDSWLSTFVTFVICVLVGLGAGYGLRQLWAPSPDSAQRSKGSRKHAGCARSWSERWAERLEEAFEAIYQFVAERCGGKNKRVRGAFRRCMDAASHALDVCDDWLEPVYVVLEEAQAKTVDFVSLVWEKCCAAYAAVAGSKATPVRHTRDFEPPKQKSNAAQSNARKGASGSSTTPADSEQTLESCMMDSENNHLLKTAATAVCAAAEAERDLSEAKMLETIEWDPVGLAGSRSPPSSLSSSNVTLPSNLMKLINPNAGQRPPAVTPTPAPPPEKRRVLQRLQKRREAASAKAAAAANVAQPETDNGPVDESWLDELEQTEAKNRQAKEVKAQQKKNKKSALQSKKNRQAGSKDSTAPEKANGTGSQEDNDEEKSAEEAYPNSDADIVPDAANEEDETAPEDVDLPQQTQAPSEVCAPHQEAPSIDVMDVPPSTSEDHEEEIATEEAKDTNTVPATASSMRVEDLLDHIRFGGGADADLPTGAVDSQLLLGEAVHGLFMLASSSGLGGAVEEDAKVAVEAPVSSDTTDDQKMEDKAGECSDMASGKEVAEAAGGKNASEVSKKTKKKSSKEPKANSEGQTGNKSVQPPAEKPSKANSEGQTGNKSVQPPAEKLSKANSEGHTGNRSVQPPAEKLAKANNEGQTGNKPVQPPAEKLSKEASNKSLQPPAEQPSKASLQPTQNEGQAGKPSEKQPKDVSWPQPKNEKQAGSKSHDTPSDKQRSDAAPSPPSENQTGSKASKAAPSPPSENQTSSKASKAPAEKKTNDAPEKKLDKSSAKKPTQAEANPSSKQTGNQHGSGNSRSDKPSIAQPKVSPKSKSLECQPNLTEKDVAGDQSTLKETPLSEEGAWNAEGALPAAERKQHLSGEEVDNSVEANQRWEAVVHAAAAAKRLTPQGKWESPIGAEAPRSYAEATSGVRSEAAVSQGMEKKIGLSSKPLAADAPDFVPFAMMQAPVEETRPKGRKGRRGRMNATVAEGGIPFMEAPAMVQGMDPFSACEAESIPITTVIISSIPCHHTAETFKIQLDNIGLCGTFDFYYMSPMRDGLETSFAVVNFIDPTFAQLCQWLFLQYPFEGQAGPSHVQGLEMNIAHWSHYCEGEDPMNAPLIIPTPEPSQWAVNGVNTMLNSKFSPQIREQFHKTKLCVFQKKNKCALGVACPFAHAKEELQPVPDLVKTKLCYNYFRQRCNDSKCKYAHGYQELRATDGVYKTELCRWWSYGGCKAGNSCRYAHGIDELRRAVPLGMEGFTMEGEFPFIPFMEGCEGMGPMMTNEISRQMTEDSEMAQTKAESIADDGLDLVGMSRINDLTANKVFGEIGHPQFDASSLDGSSDMGFSDVSTVIGGSRMFRQQTAPPASTTTIAEQNESADGNNEQIVLRVRGTFMEAVILEEGSPLMPLHRSWSDGDLPQLCEVMEGMDGFTDNV